MKKLQSASQSAAIAIASVCANLVNRHFQFSSIQEQLVIAAIRRSSSKLENASYEELGDYVGGFTPQSFVGFSNNVKGIYHELLFVHSENTDGDNVTAELFEATNHPGADVKIIEGGEVINEVQLKATDLPSLVERHIDRHPNIPVVATEEVASQMDGVLSSGASNHELEERVGSTAKELSENNPLGHAEDVAVTSGLISATVEASKVLKGEKSVNAASEQALKDMGVAVTSSFLVDLMVSS